METKLSRIRCVYLPEIRSPKPRRRFRVQEVSRNRFTTKRDLARFVESDKTSGLILRKHGLATDILAPEKSKMEEQSIVHEAQLLVVPSDRTSTTDSSPRENLQETSIWDKLSFEMTLARQPSHRFLHGKGAGYVLLLVSLLTVCIKGFTGAFHSRVAKRTRHSPIDQLRRPKESRWKSILTDSGDPQVLDSQSSPDIKTSGDEAQAESSFEEVSRAYSKLERDYRKFLSDCGMSNYGYWRGGSSG